MGNFQYERIPSLIHTWSGKFVDPLNLQSHDVDIFDIAHALSNQCRFSGHTKEFYSVAQHCVLASKIVDSEIALDALLHDAAEAYLQDMAKPLKNHPTLGQAYRGAEKRIERVLAEVFDITFPFKPGVKEADLRMLVTEARDLMHGTKQWPTYNDVQPMRVKITPWTPKVARKRFIARYHDLMKMRGAAEKVGYG